MAVLPGRVDGVPLAAVSPAVPGPTSVGHHNPAGAGRILLPLLALAGLWFLSRQSMSRYEDVLPQPVARSQKFRVLSRRRMWNGSDRTRRLQRLHLAGGVAVVVGSGAFPVAEFGGTSHQLGLAVTGISAVLIGLLGIVAVGMSYEDGIDFPGRAEQAGWARRTAPPHLPIRGLGRAGTTRGLRLSALHVGSAGERSARPGRYGVTTSWSADCCSCWWHAWRGSSSLRQTVARLAPPVGTARNRARCVLEWWPLVTVLALAVLGLGLWIQHSRSDPQAGKPRAWHGAGAAVLLGSAVWIAAVFTTSTTVLAADWLNGGGQSVADLQAGFRDEASPGARAAQMQQGNWFSMLAVRSPSNVPRSVSTQTAWSPFGLGPWQWSPWRPPARSRGVRHQVPALDLTGGRVVVEPPVTLVDSCVTASDEAPGCADAATTGEYVASVRSRRKAPSKSGHGACRVHVAVANTPQEPLIVPQVPVWFALSMPRWLLRDRRVGGVCFWYFRRHARTAIVEQTMFDAVIGVLRRDSTQARLTAGFTHRAERLLGLFGVITSVAAVAVLIGASTGSPPWQDHERLRTLAVIGLWTALVCLPD